MTLHRSCIEIVPSVKRRSYGTSAAPMSSIGRTYFEIVVRAQRWTMVMEAMYSAYLPGMNRFETHLGLV